MKIKIIYNVLILNILAVLFFTTALSAGDILSRSIEFLIENGKYVKAETMIRNLENSSSETEEVKRLFQLLKNKKLGIKPSAEIKKINRKEIKEVQKKIDYKNDPSLRYIKALLDSNRIDEAEIRLENISGKNPYALLLLGKLKYKKGNYELAFIYLDRSLSLIKDGAGSFMAGLSARVTGRFEKSRMYLLQATAIDEKSPAPPLALGNLERAQGEYEDARTYYIEALKRSPELVEAHLGMADTLFALGNEEEAVKTYAYILKKYEKYAPTCYLGLSRILIKREKYDDALKMILKAEKLEKKNIQINELKAAIFEKKRKFKEAEEEYRIILRLNPKHLQARTNIIDRQIKTRKYDDASEELKKALRLHPENAKFNYLQGVIYSEKKDYKLAEKYLRRAGKFGYNKMDTVLALGILKEKDGKKIEAIGIYQNAYETALSEGNEKLADLLDFRIKRLGGKLWNKKEKKGIPKKQQRQQKPAQEVRPDYLQELL